MTIRLNDRPSPRADAPPQLLLVDDDLTFAATLARSLGQRGFRVTMQHDGGSALRWLEGELPAYAVVDLRLPDMSGLRVVQRLCERPGTTNVLVLTGYGSIATAIEAIKLGATYYLTKPMLADQVVQAFGHRHPNPDAAPAPRPLSVDRLAWEHIQEVLARVGGNISAASRELNMHRRTLQRKLAKYAPRR